MEKLKDKRCACGNYFTPYADCQTRCVYCILESEPAQPADDAERGMRDTAFVEWFIYRWHHIRKAAKAQRKEFVWNDNVIGTSPADRPKRKYTKKKKSFSDMCIEKGVNPKTVHKRMARGWTLDEALEGKRNE